MAEFSARAPGRDRRLRQVAAWVGAAVVYGAAQGLSAWVARYAQGRGTRPQYEQFERPAFAPPSAVFPVVWPTLNLTTATSAWLVWRAGDAGPGAPSRRAVLAWWALAVIVRSGYDVVHDNPAGRLSTRLRWSGSRRLTTGLRQYDQVPYRAPTRYVPLAFGSRRLWAATADSALLCSVMANYASLARRVDRAAAALAVPEIAWTAFATVLSAAVARKNS